MKALEELDSSVRVSCRYNFFILIVGNKVTYFVIREKSVFLDIYY